MTKIVKKNESKYIGFSKKITDGIMKMKVFSLFSRENFIKKIKT